MSLSKWRSFTNNFNHDFEISVFLISLSFYFLLWFLNPGKYLMVALFLILIFIYHLIFKNFRISLLFAFISSLIILVGKTYEIQLIPEGIFPIDWYPSGYIVKLIITPSHILGFIMSLVIIYDFLHKSKYINNFHFNKYDFLISAYFFWQMLSSIFGSNNPLISTASTFLDFHIPLAYFYIRIYVKDKNLLYALIGLFAAILVFESYISAQQFINASPVGRIVESQQGIEDYGQGVDELASRFRPVGTFYHANDLGSFLTFPIFIFLSAFFASSSYWYLIVFLIGAVVLILTLSRSAWISFILGIIFLSYLLGKKLHLKFPSIPSKYLFVSLFLILILGSFFVFPRIEKSLYSFSDIEGGGWYVRQLQNEITYNLILLHPFFGVGASMSVVESLSMDTYGIFAFLPTPVHNAYLFIAIEHGIPALVIYLSFVVIYARNILGKIFRSSLTQFDKAVCLSLITGIFSFFIVALFQNILHQPYTIITLPFIDSFLGRKGINL